jgi:hypothetical protein
MIWASGIDLAMRRLSLSRSTIYRIVGILALFALDVFVGLLATRVHKPDLLLAATIAPIAVLILYRMRRIEYGILAMLLTAGLVRVKLPTGTQSEIVASLIVAIGVVGWWLWQAIWVDRKLVLKPVRTNKPVLAFIAVSIIAYVWSNLFRDPLVGMWGSFPVVQLAALTVIILLPVAFLLVSNKFEEVRWLKWLAWFIVALGALAIPTREFNISVGRIFNTGGIFPTWVAALAYAFALFDEDLPLWARGLLLGLVAAWTHYQFVKGLVWISGWAPLGLACAVITFMRSKKLFVVAVLIGLLYLGLNFDYYYEKVYADSEAEGDFQRLELWQTNMDHIFKHPLFGSGPAGYAVYYMTYHPDNARSTHNNYFDILAQTGILGFSMYIWFLLALACTGYGLARKLAKRKDFEAAFANATFGGCIAAIAAGMLGDWVIPFAYNQTIRGFDHSLYTWALLGGMVALYHIVRTREAAEPAPQPASGSDQAAIVGS